MTLAPSSFCGISDLGGLLHSRLRRHMKREAEDNGNFQNHFFMLLWWLCTLAALILQIKCEIQFSCYSYFRLHFIKKILGWSLYSTPVGTQDSFSFKDIFCEKKGTCIYHQAIPFQIILLPLWCGDIIFHEGIMLSLVSIFPCTFFEFWNIFIVNLQLQWHVHC